MRSVFYVQAVNVVLKLIINFSKQDTKGVDFPHDNALVIFVQLAHTMVDKVVVDNGSSFNILQFSVIQRTWLENIIKSLLKLNSLFLDLRKWQVDDELFSSCKSPTSSRISFWCFPNWWLLSRWRKPHLFLLLATSSIVTIRWASFSSLTFLISSFGGNLFFS